jgi:hypothetical protein
MRKEFGLVPNPLPHRHPVHGYSHHYGETSAIRDVCVDGERFRVGLLAMMDLGDVRTALLATLLIVSGE